MNHESSQMLYRTVGAIGKPVGMRRHRGMYSDNDKLPSIKAEIGSRNDRPN